MKNWTSTKRLVLGTGVLFTLSAALAAESNTASTAAAAEAPAVVAPAPAAPPAATVTVTAPARLPYGVDDVLKLSRSQINEDIIQNYIQNSGTIYNLSPNDIVYLRDQGVSDRIVAAMLDQRKRVSEATAQTTPAPAPPAQVPVPSYADATAAAAPAYNYGQPAVVDQSVPVEASAPSSVYVIPYPQATTPFYPSYYYSSYGYPYYSYYGSPYYRGYCGPSVSLGFRFGGGWHGGGSWHGGGTWHGGSHGSWGHTGGGSHGGGWHH